MTVIVDGGRRTLLRDQRRVLRIDQIEDRQDALLVGIGNQRQVPPRGVGGVRGQIDAGVGGARPVQHRSESLLDALGDGAARQAELVQLLLGAGPFGPAGAAGEERQRGRTRRPTSSAGSAA